METWQTDEIVCPYCGFEFEESYEYIGDDIVDCPNCERRFVLESEELVLYTTSKVDWLKQWKEYNRAQIARAEWRIEREKRTIAVRFDE